MENGISNSAGLNPVATVFLLAMCLVMLRAQRQTAAKAFLATAALLPLGQQILLFGFHFTFFRILILVGVCRILARGEARAFRWSALDKLLVAWAFVGLVCGVFRGPKAEMFGAAYNALGTYFLFRILIQDKQDVIENIRFLAMIAVLIGAVMVLESITHHNPFSVLGGVPDIPDMRNGRARCQGPFRHNILAGSFGASLFPLMAGLWFQDRRNRKRAIIGTIASVLITVTSVSSGALLTFVAAIIGLVLWHTRHRMRLFRRGTVAVVLALALVMKAPVWYLIAKVSDLAGGGGWHRSYLIDQFVTHFSQWWLIGTSYTANWAPDGQVLAVDPDNMDITNQYVAQGVNGGIWMFGLFLAIIVACFKIIGRAAAAASQKYVDRRFFWMLGVTLAAHCTAFISISYFDQITVFWFWLLAGITVVGRSLERSAAQVTTSDSCVPQKPVPAFSV